MDLEPVEQRILGSLLEKQVTVPASYPLTLSSLRTACNQTSSREPVMELDERTVEQTARALKARGLLRIVWSDPHEWRDETTQRLYVVARRI